MYDSGHSLKFCGFFPIYNMDMPLNAQHIFVISNKDAMLLLASKIWLFWYIYFILWHVIKETKVWIWQLINTEI